MVWILGATLAVMCLFSGPLRLKSGNTNDVNGDFSSLYETFYNLIVLLTTANHPDVIIRYYNENRGAAIFDIIFIAVGTYIFMNLFTAIMYNQFRGCLYSSVQKRIFRRRAAVRATFEVLKSNNPIPFVEASKIVRILEESSLQSWKKDIIGTKFITQFEGRPLKINEFMDLFRLLDLTTPPQTRIPVPHLENHMASQIRNFCLSNLCRKTTLFVSLVNVICIILQLVVFEQSDTLNFTFLIINTCFAWVYMLQVAINLWIHGCRNYLVMPLSLFDFFVSTCNFVLRLLEFVLITFGISFLVRQLGAERWSPYDVGQLANILVIIRTLRFSQTSSLITSVILQLPAHLAPVLGVLVSVYYVYALLGLSLFGGAIQYPNNSSPPFNETYRCGTYQQLNYWSINFDDFAASVYTLWSLMVLNNWHVIVKAYTEKLGRGVHVYMLSWWLIVAVFLLSLTQAMIIESFIFAKRIHTLRVNVRESKKHRRTMALCRLANNRQLPGGTRPSTNVSVEEEELLPAFEQPDDNCALIQESDNEIPAVDQSNIVYSFSQMFCPSFNEPSNEDLLQHLQRHSEIGALISS